MHMQRFSTNPRRVYTQEAYKARSDWSEGSGTIRANVGHFPSTSPSKIGHFRSRLKTRSKKFRITSFLFYYLFNQDFVTKLDNGS
ncbi:hypothetical protein GE061_002748 [Apolygus lucorum]|uniref:Uncharacterized protein n=1 Tax=Apolygus lucorum TaxID=248454 RepID=A0A8S9X5Z3_APOLU|nr:hypothetical protein GE061_002748 [Apolygus lucorum]